VFLSEEWPGNIAPPPQTESVTNREKTTVFKPMCLNFTYIVKSDNFPIQNYFKKEMIYRHCFFNFSLGYTIRKVQENQVELKLNGVHQLLVYADAMNVLGDNIDTVKKNMETLINISKQVGLEVNTEKTKYMLLSHHQNARQLHDIKIANRCFENVAKFKYLYLGTTTTNQNLIQEKLKED
jgi:hypothetical protein